MNISSFPVFSPLPELLWYSSGVALEVSSVILNLIISHTANLVAYSPLLLSPFLSQLVVPAAAFITLFQCSDYAPEVFNVTLNLIVSHSKVASSLILSRFLSQLVVPAAGFYEPIPMQFQSLPSAYTTHIAMGAAVTENP